jgi:Phage integrase family
MEKARVLQVVCDFNETGESTRQHGTPHEKRLERLKGCRPMTCSLLPGAALSRRTILAAPQVSDLVDLRWEQVDFNHAVQVRRVRRPASSATRCAPCDGCKGSRPNHRFVFISERGSPFTAAGFARLVERAGEPAGLGFKAARPHMLRHACGFALAEQRALEDLMRRQRAERSRRHPRTGTHPRVPPPLEPPCQAPPFDRPHPFQRMSPRRHREPFEPVNRLACGLKRLDEQ